MKKRLKFAGLLFFYVVSFFAFQFSFFVPEVHAAIEADYLDKTTIKIGSQLWRDNHPFDSDRNYFLPGGECQDETVIKDFRDSNEKATMHKYEKILDECVFAETEDVNLGNTSQKDIEGYKFRVKPDGSLYVPDPECGLNAACLLRDAQGTEPYILLPIYFLKIGPSIQVRGDTSPSIENGIFRRLPDNATKYQNDEWFLYSNGSYDPPDNVSENNSVDCATESNPYDCGGARVKGSDNSPTFEIQWCGDTAVPGGACESDQYDNVDLEQNPLDIPEEYNVEELVNNADNSDDGGDDGGDDGEPVDPTCESDNILSLNWWLCGILESLDRVIGDYDSGLLGAVDSLLDINTNSIRDNAELQQTWSYFRAIASFALVAVGLAMVISQALSGGR